MLGGRLTQTLLVCLVAVAALLLPGIASAAECTDTWTGPSGGEWQLAENWSAEHVPTAEDVACIPKEGTAKVTEGTQYTELLQGEGDLTITGGSLGVLGTGEFSNIGTLHLSGGALRGPGELFVTSSLTADGGSMEGAGETVVGSEASGRVEPVEEEGPGLRITETRTLTANGELTVAGEGGKLNLIEGAGLSVGGAGSFTVGGPEGRLTVTESASLANYGETATNGPEGQTNLIEHASLLNEGAFVLKAPEGGLVANENAVIENAGSLRMEASEGEIRLEEARLENESALRIEASKGRLRGSKGARIENSGTLAVNGQEEGNGLVAGSGAIPVLLNEGTVRKDEGSGTAFVEFKTNNESLVKSESGTMRFTGGGGSGAEQKDKWVAEGEEAELDFSGALFTLGDLSEMRGSIYLLKSAIVKGHKILGGQAEVWIPEGKLKITGAGERSNFEGLSLTVGEINLFENAELETEETFVGGGLLNLGEGSDGDLGSLFQSGGRTISRRNTTVISDSIFVEHGRLTLAADSSLEFESYFQEATTTVNIESGSGVTGTSAFVQGGSLELRSDTHVAVDQFFQEHGTVNLRSDASLVSEQAFLETGGGVFEMGADSSLVTAELYDGGITTIIGSSAALIAEDAYLEKGVLKGSGTFTADHLDWENAKMSGSGTTIVSESGQVSASSFAELEHRRLVTHGEFSLGESTLVMGNGAQFENNAAFDASSEASGGAQIRVAGESGTNPRIVNKAEFSKTEGVGTTTVSVPFENDGRVRQLSGVLDIKNRLGVPASEKFGQRCTCGDPIDTASGDFSETQDDIAIGGRGIGLDLSRTYDAIAAATATSPGVFGYGWSNDFSDHLSFEEEEVVVEVEPEAEEEVEEPGEGEEEVAEEGEEEWEEIEEEAETEEEWEEVEAEEEQDVEESEEESWEEQTETIKRVTVVGADGSTTPFTEDAEGALEAPPWSQDTLSGGSEAGYTFTDASQVELHFSPGGALQSVTDRNGNETTLSYDESGRLEAIADPAGRQIVLSYGEEGLVESAEDPMGHVVSYGYEGGELTSVTMPGEEEPRWQFGYDESHRLTSMIDGRGGDTSNEYDSKGRVVSQTDPAGRTLGIEYDGFHTRITNEATGAVTDQWFNSDNEPFQITNGYGTAQASTETMAYDEAGHLLERTDPDGHTTTYTYNGAGDRTSMTDAAEQSTEWAYNGTHDVTSETTPRGETTTITRDEHGNPETISRPAPGEATQSTSFEYDAAGQLEAMTDPLGHTWLYEHDEQGDLSAETNPEGDTASWEYDEDSRLLAKVSPRGNAEGAEAAGYTTSYERDPQGRPLAITDPLGHATEYTYDGNGSVKTETDPNGHTTTYTYNADDEPIEVEKPNGDTTETGYDGAGKVSSQTDGNGQTTEYVRDVLERPVEVIDPLGRATTQEYDAAGNLSAKTDPEERTTSYDYGNVDRLAEVTYSDESTPGAEFSYDKNVDLVGMSDGTGESSFEYDQLDRLTGAEDGHGDTVAYEYDLADRQTGLTYPNGKAVSRTFDKANRLASVGDWLGNTTSFAYDHDSALSATTFPSGTGNVDEYDHDRADRVSEITMRRGEETLAALGYGRDDAGQVEAQGAIGLPGPESEAFSYDENNRLTEAGSESFEYDAADNMTKAPGTANSYDKAGQLEEGTGVEYTYDKEGERTKAASGPYLGAFGSKGMGEGQLQAPSGLLLDPEGDLWVADTENNRLEHLGREGNYLGQIGAAGSGAGKLASPRGLAADSEGNLWVADSGNDRIEQFSPEGAYLGELGEAGSGAGQLSEPQGVAVGGGGDLWVADTANNRIERWSAGVAPAATSEAASEASPTAATLKGSVDPEGLATDYRFEYDTSAYGKGEAPHGTKLPTPDRSAGSGEEAVAVSERARDLEASTTYHYRLVASNAGGTAYGEDESFTTPAAGAATTDPATEVSAHSATLNATIDPEGKPTDYWFEYWRGGAYPLPSGAALWYEADQIEGEDGSRVAGWPDESGNERDATQAEETKQPVLEAEALNGKPVVYFDGENDLLRDTGFKLSQPNTAFVVGKTDAKFGAFFDGTESYYYRNMVQRSYPEQWSMSAGSGVVGGKADEEPHIFTALFDEANSELRERTGKRSPKATRGRFRSKGSPSALRSTTPISSKATSPRCSSSTAASPPPRSKTSKPTCRTSTSAPAPARSNRPPTRRRAKKAAPGKGRKRSRSQSPQKGSPRARPTATAPSPPAKQGRATARGNPLPRRPRPPPPPTPPPKSAPTAPRSTPRSTPKANRPTTGSNTGGAAPTRCPAGPPCGTRPIRSKAKTGPGWPAGPMSPATNATRPRPKKPSSPCSKPKR